HQKIALIARNGAGKTSLLNIITGNDTPDEGRVVSRNGIHIAFLPQQPRLDPDLTVEETIFASGNTTLKIIQRYEKALQNPTDTDAYQKAFEQMDIHNAWDFETQYKQILSRLKLDDLDQKTATLSGGQKKRLALATALINKPDILILDEPTNHLDLESITTFNNALKNFKGTVIFTTHDHEFAQTVANRVIELTPNGIIDKFMTFDGYMDDTGIKAQRNKMYSIVV
ncbi:MAG: ABC-F family ATP-binding cassette domain-containing protein, partial [Sinomicrobium sp.]|nr:ABC-F family ATP-binding cassette domain-containing protein [Sinomicrobium sp.]